MIRLASLCALLLVAATPAQALSCLAGGGAESGTEYGDNGGVLSFERDRVKDDLDRLRASGVDATRVDYWGGCLQAFVKNADGSGEHMELYLEDSLQRVQ